VTLITNSIKEEAAKAIGLILFEFTNLETEVGLCVVWTNEGQNLKKLSAKYNGKSFNDRLNFIEKLAYEIYSLDSEELTNYVNWIKEANEVRVIRNQLIHGRYGFIPSEGCVANVVDLPTSSNQSETRYTIKQLYGLVKRINKLSVRLNELRTKYPI
jgi:hypothetical protein